MPTRKRSTRTIILPGLGGDATMFPSAMYERLSWVSFVDWPPYNGEETISAVAERVIDHCRIGEDTIVGGASLGGMVAIQIARLLKLEKVILIGSATSPEQVNPLLHKLSTLVEITPIKLIQTLARKINGDGRDELLTMFGEADSDFIRAMCKAIFIWEGLGDLPAAICHIHGSADRVIFPPARGATIIPGGGHVISMTHADLVSDFIRVNSAPA